MTWASVILPEGSKRSKKTGWDLLEKRLSSSSCEQHCSQSLAKIIFIFSSRFAISSTLMCCRIYICMYRFTRLYCCCGFFKFLLRVYPPFFLFIICSSPGKIIAVKTQMNKPGPFTFIQKSISYLSILYYL